MAMQPGQTGAALRDEIAHRDNLDIRVILETKRRAEGDLNYLFTLDDYWTLDGAVDGSGGAAPGPGEAGP